MGNAGEDVLDIFFDFGYTTAHNGHCQDKYKNWCGYSPNSNTRAAAHRHRLAHTDRLVHTLSFIYIFIYFTFQS